MKFKAKRMALEGMSCLTSSLSWIDTSHSSGWYLSCSGTKTSDGTNARRISTAEQDSLPAKSARINHEGSTHFTILPVRFVLHFTFSVHSIHWHRYPNLHEVRLIPQKKDIAFIEFMDEGSASIAKDALHNYKLDGENKIKARIRITVFLKSQI